MKKIDFKDEAKELAVHKRYGKAVEVLSTVELNDDKTVKYHIAKITSPKGQLYTLTEYLKNNLTDYVLVDFTNKNGRTFNHRYDRYLDAEIRVIDLISEE